MATADPRQRGLFGAAWMIGAVAATEASKVERIALAAPAGPLGLMDGDRALPAFHVFAALTEISDRDRLAATSPAGIAAIAASSPHGTALIIANLGIEPREVALPQAAQFAILDTPQPGPHWLAAAPRQHGSTLSLGAYAVAFASIGPHDFFGPSS
jgi:D-apionolactonase